MPDLQALHDAVLNGDAKSAKAVTEAALAAGVEPLKLVQEYMMPAMAEVGRRFEANEYFVPELLLAARAMKAALELVRPLLTAQGAQPTGRVALGTVKGDLHDIGKNLVGAMLEGGGFEVVDLGVNVSPEQFVAAVKEKGVNIVAMSALLTTTMPAMKSTVDALKDAGVRDQVKIIIGGAPVTQKYAAEIGADGFSESAASAPGLAQQMMG
jgi:5-methyltetrahydrofolate--homocysteine methyltransferase